MSKHFKHKKFTYKTAWQFVLLLLVSFIVSFILIFVVSGTSGIRHILWHQDYVTGNVMDGNAGKNLRYIAKVDHIQRIPSPRNINLHIKRRSRTYGILNEMGFLKPKRYYVLKFHYYSQLYPLYAPDACEATTLRMALSAKGLAKHVSMRKFINRIPRSKDPRRGYTENPYLYGDSASIYPQALSRYAYKYYHAKVDNISGASKKKFIDEIKHGNPIVFEGSYQMRDIDSDHTLVIIGYRSGHPGQFLVADPFMWHSQRNKIFWTSTSDFMSIYKSSMRGQHALAVTKRIKPHKKKTASSHTKIKTITHLLNSHDPL